MKQKLILSKVNKIDKPLTRLTKKGKKREDNCQHQERSKDITTDPADIKKVLREYYQKLYLHKFVNLDEMGQLPKKHKLLQLT